MDEVIIAYMLPAPRLHELIKALSQLPIHPSYRKQALTAFATALNILLTQSHYQAAMGPPHQ